MLEQVKQMQEAKVGQGKGKRVARRGRGAD